MAPARLLVALAVALLGAGAACDPRLYAKGHDEKVEPRRSDPNDKGDKGDDDDEPAAPLSPLSALGALGQSKEPGPFDEPLRSRSAGTDKAYAAVLELDGSIVELAQPFSFSLTSFGATNGIALRQLAGKLARLDADKDVTAIVLRLRDLDLGLATAEELRGLLAGLKKPTLCHVEQASNAVAVVLSGCKRVVLAPGGGLLVNGPAAVPLYFKGLLDLAGGQVDVVRVSAYKGAAEPFLRSEPSPEMRETYDDLLGGAYRNMVVLIAAGRHVDAKKVEGWIDQGIFDAPAAKAAGLVDDVATFEAARDAAAPDGAWRRVKLTENKAEDFMTLIGLRPKKRVKGERIALLYAVGNVVDGKGGVGGAFEEIASGRLAPALRAAAANDDVKAIVVRIDSPGGSALASEIIWQAMAEAARRKPVMVSMARLAASGGYYIAAPATRIFAQLDTLTGSIGVFSMKLVLGGVMDKVGVRAVELGRGKRAFLESSVRPWSDDERQAMTAAIQSVYDLFKRRVAEGRHQEPATVEKNAQGRVWTGAEALRRGLVDELGGLDDALAAARAAAKLPASAPVDVYPGEPSLADLLGAGDGAKTAASLERVLEPAAAAAALLGPRAAGDVRAALRLVVAAQAAPVQAAAFLPEIR
jgi:protease-4